MYLGLIVPLFIVEGFSLEETDALTAGGGAGFGGGTLAVDAAFFLSSSKELYFVSVLLTVWVLLNTFMAILL